eukprot:scaffold10667_cov132-Isochrysis_galbana.AAC.8
MPAGSAGARPSFPILRGNLHVDPGRRCALHLGEPDDLVERLASGQQPHQAPEGGAAHARGAEPSMPRLAVRPALDLEHERLGRHRHINILGGRLRHRHEVLRHGAIGSRGRKRRELVRRRHDQGDQLILPRDAVQEKGQPSHHAVGVQGVVEHHPDPLERSLVADRPCSRRPHHDLPLRLPHGAPSQEGGSFLDVTRLEDEKVQVPTQLRHVD